MGAPHELGGSRIDDWRTRRPDAGRGAAADDAPAADDVLAAALAVFVAAALAAAARSCCRSSPAWRSPICSTRSPTGWSGSASTGSPRALIIIGGGDRRARAGRSCWSRRSWAASSAPSSTSCPATSTRLQSLLSIRAGLGCARSSAASCPDADKIVGDLVTQGVGLDRGASCTSLWSGGQALVSLFSLVVVTPVVAFYLLYDWHRMVATVDSWIPRAAPRHRARARARDRRGDRRLRARADGGLPDPRLVLCGGADARRAEFRPADRA